MIGVFDLLERASHRIRNETLSKLIQPLKRSLYTNDPIVIRRVLLVLQKLSRGNDGAIGIALVPYFTQLLPIVKILKQRTQTTKHSSIIDDFKKNVQNDLNIV